MAAASIALAAKLAAVIAPVPVPVMVRVALLQTLEAVSVLRELIVASRLSSLAARAGV